jgi:hypothetical protein
MTPIRSSPYSSCSVRNRRLEARVPVLQSWSGRPCVCSRESWLQVQVLGWDVEYRRDAVFVRYGQVIAFGDGSHRQAGSVVDEVLDSDRLPP